MVGSGITFTGLGSGIDTASLVDRLVQLESLRKGQLEAKKTTAQDKVSAIGSFQTLVKALQTKAEGLASTSDFLELRGSASREGVLSFDVSSSAVQGTHSIEVQQLAAFDRWAFDGVADPAVALGSGPGEQVTFTVGGTAHAIDVDPSTSSLNEIADAINTAAGDEVAASVVNVGTQATPNFKLVLASKVSGESGRITGIGSTVAGLTIDGTEPASGTSTPASANNLTVGQNAKALVDGLLVERDTNEFSGVLAGVSFTAQSAEIGNPVEISIEPDTTAIKSSLKEFAEAYNAVVRYVNQQNTYSEESGAGGVLFGDSTVSLVSSRLRDALFNVDISVVEGDTEGYSTLGLVGLDVQKDGTIVVDESKLDEKIAANLDLLADLFTDDDGDGTADTGLAAKLADTIKSLVDRGTGPGGEALTSVFGAKTDSLQASIKELDKRIEDEEYRLGKFEENLRARFTNLETVLAQLNSQSSALAALFS
jgi:flagellar hook-associated protein 2